MGFKKVGPQWNATWGRSWDGQASPPYFHPGTTGPSPTFFFQEPRTPGTASWSRLMASLCGRRGRGLRELGGEGAGAHRRVNSEKAMGGGGRGAVHPEWGGAQRTEGCWCNWWPRRGLPGSQTPTPCARQVPLPSALPLLPFLRDQRTPEPQPT